VKTSPLHQAKSHYDIVIVGGGIVGAGLFRDLCLHGLSPLLIDARDFGSQTSAKSSKMLHGGIRYLENMDFALVREALHEKNLWLKIAPHLCYEEAFYLPVYNDSIRPLWMIRAGLFLYDFLSGFENTPHSVANKEETLKALPHLNPHGLKGAGIYHDAVMDDVKMALEAIYDGLEEGTGAQAMNYVELTNLSEQNSDERMLTLKDCLTGEQKQIRAKHIVFATGPFTDQVLAKFFQSQTPKLLPSKGSHLWIKSSALPVTHPMLITPKDGRVIFVIPQKGRVLVGTTEIAPESNQFFDLTPSVKEINYLLEALAGHFPTLSIGSDDILASFAGIRPLAREDDGGHGLGKTAREHKVLRPASHVYAIVGGKYTTFRTMVQEVAAELVHAHRLPYSTRTTMTPMRRTSAVLPFNNEKIVLEQIELALKTELPRTFDDLLIRRLGLLGVTEEFWPESLKQLMSEELNPHSLPNLLF
jgi:glycerol-3-phosphate dehydrogenase